MKKYLIGAFSFVFLFLASEKTYSANDPMDRRGQAQMPVASNKAIIGKGYRDPQKWRNFQRRFPGAARHGQFQRQQQQVGNPSVIDELVKVLKNRETCVRSCYDKFTYNENVTVAPPADETAVAQPQVSEAQPTPPADETAVAQPQVSEAQPTPPAAETFVAQPQVSEAKPTQPIQPTTFPELCAQAGPNKPVQWLETKLGIVEQFNRQWVFTYADPTKPDGANRVHIPEDVGLIGGPLDDQVNSNIIVKSLTPQGYVVEAHIDPAGNNNRGVVKCLSQGRKTQ